VGAALLDAAGGVHAGCNVENAAYPQSQCAEASAIGVMVAAGSRRIMAVAVAGQGPSPVTPCGGCRQRLREFAADHTPVLVADPSGLRLRTTLGELLPHAFGPAHLEPGQ
jgi:cytidine deaminase